MKLNSFIKNEYILHLIFWFGFYCFFVFSRTESTGLTVMLLWTSSVLVGIYIPPVYLNIYVLSHILPKKQYLRYLFFFGITVVIGGIILQDVFFNIFDISRHRAYWILYLSFMLLFTSGIKFGYNSLKQHLNIEKIKARQFETELDLLKSQINPHFFFNTLNNIFYLANEENAERTADGISTLSHLMRYMVYENNDQTISLKKEIEQINRYIRLQKLKFSPDDKIDIQFNIDGEFSDFKIPPMIFFPFIENAFKHGISMDRPSEIIISINLLNKNLTFSVKNRYFDKLKEEIGIGGIGLVNVRKRLDLIFGEQYHLGIEKKDGYHSVNLVLDMICFKGDL
ncbi:MAG: hypothetical protein GY714_28115 [Desulfobacterales bacterium]|nr:hypothetical protein [Desulfobacterales bacterium]